MTRPLCIYHGNCADGFAAAWVVWKHFSSEVDLHAGVYGEAPPDVSGRDVIIVDFSYKRLPLSLLVINCASLLILDHHKSAIEDLEKFDEFLGHQGLSQKYKAVLDTTRSGAMIAWDYFFPGQAPPRLLQHVQDRDLWKFELEGTEDIQAGLFSYPYDMAIWDYYMLNKIDGTLMSFNEHSNTPTPVVALHNDGIAINRKHHRDIAELLKVTKRRMNIGGHDVPVANLPYTMSSDAGHALGKGEKFAACYWDTPTGRVFSLRSAPEGLDVAKIAMLYGGGGHQHASGFTKPIGWEGEPLGWKAEND